jgi:hypothetical protein
MGRSEDRPRVTREHVERAAADLRARGLLSDTSPDLPDGRRSAERWLAAVHEDAGIVQLQLEATLREGANKLDCLGSALHEARRMVSDIYRFASEVHGLRRDDIDGARY